MPVSSPGDADLVLRYRSGDVHAGELLADRYYAKILRYCQTKAPQAAKDITHESFAACFGRLDALREPAAFRSYLFGIASNQLRLHYRRQATEGAHIDFEASSSIDLDPSPSQVMGARAEQRLLLEGLRRIPLDYQIALELHYWQAMPVASIAEALSIPISTVKTRLQRGRKRLETVMAELEASSEVLESTLGDLEGWARCIARELELPAPR